MNIIKNITNSNFIRTGLFLFSVFIVLIFSGVRNFVNDNTEKVFNKINFESQTDSNIIIIEITHDDIEKLGSWPIKRSYYALLLSYLEKYQPKKIGFGIFLSENSSSQSIYNQLLSKEIDGNRNIVFASLLSGLNIENGITQVDSILYPVLRKNHEDLITGHLDYFFINGIYIPTAVSKNKRIEYAFSSEISGRKKIPEGNLFKLNPFITHENYKTISLLEFLKLSTINSPELNFINNKIVLIGVTDPSIISDIRLANGEYVSGIYIHAIAVDNILNGQYLNVKYFNISGYLFLIIILLLIILRRNISAPVLYSVCSIVFVLVSAVLFNIYYMELNYALYIIPVLFIAISEIPIYIKEKDKQLSDTISESEALRNLLIVKQAKLAELENRLQKENSPSIELTNEIEILKKQIEEYQTRENLESQFEFDSSDESNNFQGIIYHSRKMAVIVDMIQKVAPQNATVLVTGETGSGKELVARALHKLSQRNGNNFIAINCAAISETLLESELFGHKKGAFTNAVTDKKGMFEAADKGTIFLDEIGETSESFQVKLLRVLQSGEIQKVGSVDTIHVDVRIVAATNKNLEKLVAEKKFREDLYYRLKVVEIDIPPLRERKEDIEILVKHFLEKEDSGLKISKGVLAQLIDNDWKGNVRELEGAIARATIFAKGENRNIIKLCDLPDEMAKLSKTDLGNLILDSLREKEFSHSAINETAKELGGLSRTSVSEHYRGMFFKEFVNNNFELDKAVKEINTGNSDSAEKKIYSKGKTYINNIEKDITKLGLKDFAEVKEHLKTKYKNLPNRYHIYLDKVIEFLMEKQ